MRTYLRQGEAHFKAGFKLQTRWGSMEAVIFTFECTGAALFAAAILDGEQAAGMAAGIALVTAAIALLLLHLGHPARAWRATLNVRTSWISRGTFVLGGVVVIGVLYLLLRHGGGMQRTSDLAYLLRWILLAACAFILIYPGLILSASPAIPFWNSGLLPVFSAVGGAASGLALLHVIAHASVQSAALTRVMPLIEFWLLVLLAAVIAVHLAVMLRRGAAAAESAVYLLRDHVWLFVLGGCVIGLVLPMLLSLWKVGGGGDFELALLVAVLRLTGDYAARQAFLKVGMFNPIV